MKSNSMQTRESHIIWRGRIFIILILSMINFSGIAYAQGPTVSMSLQPIEKTDKGFLVRGEVTGANLNPKGQVVEYDAVTIIADIQTGSNTRYPLLPEGMYVRAPAGAESSITKGSGPGGTMKKTERDGIGITSVRIAKFDLRKHPVWSAYGGIGVWRKNAPDSVTKKFEGYIPLEYAGKKLRIRALLEHSWGGPSASWPAFSFANQVGFTGKLKGSIKQTGECPLKQISPEEYAKIKHKVICITNWQGDEIEVDTNGNDQFIDLDGCDPKNGPIMIGKHTVIITGFNSHTTVLIGGYGKIKIHKNTTFSVDDYIITNEGITPNTNMKIGDVDIEVDRKFKEIDFSVSTPTCIVGVRGTIFHVSHRKNPDITTVCVDRGKVEVTPKLFSKKAKMVMAGQCITVDEHSFGKTTGTGAINNSNNHPATGKSNYSFNGIDSYTSMPNKSASDLRRGQALTISLWFKASDLKGVKYSSAKWGQGWRTILSKSNGYSGSCIPKTSSYKAIGYILRIMKGKLQFSLRNNNFKRNYADLYSPNIRPNQWYHVVVEISAIPGNGFAKMYLNGKKVDSKIISNPTDYIYGKDLHLGATYYDRTPCKSPTYYNYVNGSTGMSQFFKGEIRNVEIYNKILSYQEIANLYASTKRFKERPNTPSHIPPSNQNLHGITTVKGQQNSQFQNNTDISGTWHWFDGETVWINKNGTSQSSQGNKGHWSKKWNGTKYIYTINWNNGQYIDNLTLNKNTLNGHNQGGTHVWGKRISNTTQGYVGSKNRDKKNQIGTNSSNYLGCFYDKSDRDIKGYSFGSEKMTPELCISTCRTEGYKYAAIQFSKQCFCGNTYGRYGKTPKENECNYKCSGDKNKICGGYYRNSIYTTGNKSYNRQERCRLYAVASLNQYQTNTEQGCRYIGHLWSPEYNYYYNSCMKESVKESLLRQKERQNLLKNCKSKAQSNPIAGYLGCFVDKSARDLDKYSFGDAKMTPELCTKTCSKQGFKYAAVQYSSQCFCGDTYGKYGKAQKENECSYKCSGDKNEICGGYYRNSIYGIIKSAGSGIAGGGQQQNHGSKSSSSQSSGSNGNGNSGGSGTQNISSSGITNNTGALQVKPTPRRYVAAIRYRSDLGKQDFYPPGTKITFSYTFNTPLRPGDKILKEKWYINGRLKKTNTPGLTSPVNGFPVQFRNRFETPGIYTIELRIYSTPTQFTKSTQVIKIGRPNVTPVPNQVQIVASPTPPYKMPVTITFTSKPQVSSGYWYVNGVFIRTGDNLTYTFKDPGVYKYKIELRRTSDEPALAEKWISLEKGVGVLGAWRNRFKTRNNASNLEICSIYWMGGSGKWSSCNSFVRGKIGAVDGYDLCTGEQSDGYNTGWLVYSPKNSGVLKFKVFAFNFSKWKGYEKYAGQLKLHGKRIIPGSINFVECKQRAATVEWRNQDGSRCKAKIWKTLPSSPYSKNVFIPGGVEDLGCTKVNSAEDHDTSWKQINRGGLVAYRFDKNWRCEVKVANKVLYILTEIVAIGDSGKNKYHVTKYGTLSPLNKGNTQETIMQLLPGTHKLPLPKTKKIKAYKYYFFDSQKNLIFLQYGKAGKNTSKFALDDGAIVPQIIVKRLNYHNSSWIVRLKNGKLEVSGDQNNQRRWSAKEWKQLGTHVDSFIGVGTGMGPLVIYRKIHNPHKNSTWTAVLLNYNRGSKIKEITKNKTITIVGDGKKFGAFIKVGGKCYDFSSNNRNRTPEIDCRTHRFTGGEL